MRNTSPHRQLGEESAGLLRRPVQHGRILTWVKGYRYTFGGGSRGEVTWVMTLPLRSGVTTGLPGSPPAYKGNQMPSRDTTGLSVIRDTTGLSGAL